MKTQRTHGSVFPSHLFCYQDGIPNYLLTLGTQLILCEEHVMSLFKDFVQTLIAKSITEEFTCAFVQALSDLQYQEYFE